MASALKGRKAGFLNIRTVSGVGMRVDEGDLIPIWARNELGVNENGVEAAQTGGEVRS